MSSFDHIDTWVFDLDNTLYPASCRLFDQINLKMGAYMMRRFGVDHAEARRIQKDLFYKYGTTLRGLMVEHGEAPGQFLDEVHALDYSPVKADPLLAEGLAKLSGRRLVFTAGTVQHAANVLQRLGIVDAFEGVFDIVAAGYIPKPQRDPYDTFVAQYSVDARRAAMFEDIARNLEVPHEIGMTTVLVTDHENHDAKHLNTDADGPHVHHRTSHLAGFLMTL